MNVRCLNCGHEFKLRKIWNDELIPEGFFTVCPECKGSFDIDDDVSDNIRKKMFIDDVAKMADFFHMPKDDFLASYSYLTEDEYDATEMYVDWICRTKAAEEWDICVDEEFVLPTDDDDADTWGVITVWNDKLERGAEYNYCIEDGDNMSAIYLTFEDETDTSTYESYVVDFKDPYWKRKLIDRMKLFVEANC